MWTKTRITEMAGITYPIIQAGMAGGITSPQLVAAVSNAGGLGSVGAGYLTPGQLRSSIKEIRALTDKPFAVNLFIPGPYRESPVQIEEVMRLMEPVKQELRMEEEPVVDKYEESFEEQLEVVIEEKVPVFSFTFGTPSVETIRRLKSQGILVMGTATTVREAILLQESGVDAIVAQGSEAGGHRGTFIGDCASALLGTIVLVPQIVDEVEVPVIAAGGIMDGRGIAAACALGASAVQMGTAFITCTESAAHPKHQEAILTSTDQSTAVTRAFSGKPARGIANAFMEKMAPHEHRIPDYPIQNALTRNLRKEAAKQNKPEYMSLWAGQGAPLSSQKSAAQLVEDLVTETSRIIGNL